MSYNLLPGCFVRRVDVGRDPASGCRRRPVGAERVEAARQLGRRPGRRLVSARAARLAASRGRVRRPVHADRQRDRHDELVAGQRCRSTVTPFIRHAGAHGLGFLAEAEPSTMAATGLPPRMQQIIAAPDPLAREQWLDFARVRKFRQSILARAADVAQARLTPAGDRRAAVSASTTVRAGARTRERVPAATRCSTRWSTPIRRAFRRASSSSDSSRAARRAGASARGHGPLACFAGSVRPARAAARARASARRSPAAFPVARWQAARREILTNLRHEGVRLDDDVALRAARRLRRDARSARARRARSRRRGTGRRGRRPLPRALRARGAARRLGERTVDAVDAFRPDRRALGPRDRPGVDRVHPRAGEVAAFRSRLGEARAHRPRGARRRSLGAQATGARTRGARSCASAHARRCCSSKSRRATDRATVRRCCSTVTSTSSRR